MTNGYSGDGGDGLPSIITGKTVYYGGGGGGGCGGNSPKSGGGGNGGSGGVRGYLREQTTAESQKGVDGLGGGGAGGSSGNNQLGANGGSGVVIIRYSAKPKGLTVIVR